MTGLLSKCSQAALVAALLSGQVYAAEPQATEAESEALEAPTETAAPLAQYTPAQAQPGVAPAQTPSVVTPAPRQTLEIPQAPPALSTAAQPAVTINVSAIEDPSIDELGTLQENEGGLPATIWKGSNYASASSLLTWVKSGIAHEGLRTQVINLLLSRAIAPEGSKGDWLTKRAEALVALGAEDKALQLLGTVPSKLATPSVKKLQAQLMLLKDDNASACQMAQAHAINDEADLAFWQKLNIICKAAAGKYEEANLALDLLRESGAKDDPFLQDIVHAFSDKKFQIKNLPASLSLLDFSAIKMAGELDRIRDKLDSLPPVTLKYILAVPKLEQKFFEKAQSKALATGMIAPSAANKTPPMPFAAPLASDVTTLVNALGTGNPPGEAENTVIARLEVDAAAATQDTRRALRLLSIMEVFGYQVPASIWDKLFDRKGRYDGEIPPAALLDRLNVAAGSGHKGEVLMLSALILESADIEKIHEVVLVPVIKALNSAGFTKEARSIAYDAVQSYRAP